MDADPPPILAPEAPTREPDGPRTHAEASRQRRDIASGAVMDEAQLIRFVIGPDGAVTPDVGRDLPGRGLWVEATREAVQTAAKRGAFARAAKRQAAVPADLAARVEALLVRRCLDRLGLARRAGALTSGFETVSSALAGGRVAWLIEASDGAEDGRAKLLRLARRQPSPPKICGAFSADELSLALGVGHAIHLAFLSGRWAMRWTGEFGRLAGFRATLPERWREEPGSGWIGDPDPAQGFSDLDETRPPTGAER